MRCRRVLIYRKNAWASLPGTPDEQLLEALRLLEADSRRR
jgi:hypothetical protein